MSKKDEIRRDFQGTMANLLESFDKGFYKSFDENNSKIMMQVLHEELQAILKMNIMVFGRDVDLMEEFMRINQ